MSDKRIADGLKAAIDGDVRVSAPTDPSKGKLLTKDDCVRWRKWAKSVAGSTLPPSDASEGFVTKALNTIEHQAALLDQAETEKETFGRIIDKDSKLIEEAHNRTAKMEEALKWYADERNWNEQEWEYEDRDGDLQRDAVIPVDDDGGERAREVLWLFDLHPTPSPDEEGK